MKKLAFVLLCIALLFAASCGKRDGQGQPESSDGANGVSGNGAEEEAASVSNGNPGAESDASPAEGDTRPVLTLTIPEGYTLARIGMTLEDVGVCTVEEFISASQELDGSDFPLVAQQQPSDARCFKLEGYLYPDTYQIYSDELPEAIIRKMLTRMEEKITPDVRAQIDASGYSVDQIIALASIIEKESLGRRYMSDISSVLHNRLDNGMQLQCDVTITYVTGAIQPFITGDRDRYNAYYNTYRCAGIPAGAICNPSVDAIMAALNPAETDYLFFVTDADDRYYFAATWEEHLENVAVAMPE